MAGKEIKSPGNIATGGAGTGGALGFLIVQFGPQFGWFEAFSGSEGAAVAAAMGVVFAFVARYLPEPKR